MPGLIRGVARTAAVVGTAGAVNHRQQQRWAAKEQQAAQAQAYQEQQAAQQYAPPPQQYAQPPQQYAPPPPAPAPAAAPSVDLVAELSKLADLKASGVLSDAEFEAAKAKLIAG